MELNHLLQEHGIDPKGVMVLRHRPKEPELRKVLSWLANESPEIYNAYQQSQGPKVEKAMQNAEYVASFIGREPGKALFVGLYKMDGSRAVSFKEYWKIKGNVELKKFGMNGMQPERESVQWFDLTPMDFFADWKGKLVVQWPGKELSWWRWAEKNKFSVLTIHEDSRLVRDMPHWTKLVMTWKELEVLPTKWRDALAQWRCVYFILDGADGKGYVGVAYGDVKGEENLYGRWHNYGKSGHGGNKLLRQRPPDEFRFTILERVSPDMIASDLQALEATWKKRLHTREFGLNDN